MLHDDQLKPYLQPDVPLWASQFWSALGLDGGNVPRGASGNVCRSPERPTTCCHRVHGKWVTKRERNCPMFVRLLEGRKPQSVVEDKRPDKKERSRCRLNTSPFKHQCVGHEPLDWQLNCWTSNAARSVTVSAEGTRHARREVV